MSQRRTEHGIGVWGVALYMVQQRCTAGKSTVTRSPHNRRMQSVDPILHADINRFAIFPIRYPSVRVRRRFL